MAKRVTIGIWGAGYLFRAREVLKYLQSRGVDCKIVTKHAVQVAPGMESIAAELITKEHPEWLKKPENEP